jgi:hypothetical protein
MALTVWGLFLSASTEITVRSPVAGQPEFGLFKVEFVGRRELPLDGYVGRVSGMALRRWCAGSGVRISWPHAKGAVKGHQDNG